MSRTIFSFIFLVRTVCIYSQSWTQLSDFPGTQRDDGCSFTIGDKAYCFSGLEVGWQCTGDGFIFNDSLETWSPMVSLPTGKERQYAAAFSSNGQGYLLGGLNGANVCLKDFWQYSVSGNSWTALPDFPGTGRQGMSNFIIKNKVYIIGGRDQSNTTLNEVWEYNFSTTAWTQKNNLPLAGMWRGAAFSIDTVGYICYGQTNTATASSYNHQMYQYDHTSDTWSIVPNIILPARNYIACAVTNKKACLYGGQDSLDVITNDVKLFDPMNTSLVTFAGVPTIGRKGTMFFSINDVFYITTGLDATQNRIKETWKNTAFVGLKENSTIALQVYPNPVNDKLNIVPNTSKASLQLYNQMGESMLEIEVTGRTEINTESLANGLYFLVIKTSEGNASKKILITH